MQRAFVCSTFHLISIVSLQKPSLTPLLETISHPRNWSEMRLLVPLILSIFLGIASPLAVTATDSGNVEVCLFLGLAYRSLAIGLHSKATTPRELKDRAALPPRDLGKSAVSKIIHIHDGLELKYVSVSFVCVPCMW